MSRLKPLPSLAILVLVLAGCSSSSERVSSCGGLGISSHSPALILWAQSSPR